MEQLSGTTYKLSDKEILEKKGSEWRIVYPIKKDPDKSFFKKDNILWFNFLTGGSISRLVQLGVILVLLSFLMWSYSHDIEECRELIERNNLLYPRNPLIPIIEYDEELLYNISVSPQDTSS